MNRISPSLIARIRALNHSRRLMPVNIQPRLCKLPGIRAILFDVYGTLVDSGIDPSRSFSRLILSRKIQNALRQAGLNPCDTQAGLSISDALQEKIAHAHRLARARGIDYPEVDIRNIWKQVFCLSIQRGWIKGTVNANVITRVALEFEGVQNPVALMPGVKNALARLRQRGVKMGIVSNAQFYTPLVLQVLFGASLARIGFDRSLCIWSYRLGRAKPSPDLLNLALKRIRQKYGLKPREVLVIGNDWTNDLAPARRFGCRTALLAGSKRSVPHLRNAGRPDLLLTHWSQLENIWIKKR
jgi:putative hydrolase of the HAD superfamily